MTNQFLLCSSQEFLESVQIVDRHNRIIVSKVILDVGDSSSLLA